MKRSGVRLWRSSAASLMRSRSIAATAMWQLTSTLMVKRTATVQSTIRVAHPPTMTPKPTAVGDL